MKEYEHSLSAQVDGIEKNCRLDDLLKTNDFNIYADNLYQLGIDIYGVTFDDGKIFYHSHFISREKFSKIIDYFTTKNVCKGKAIEAGKVMIFVSAIEHDFEEIGFLWTGISKSTSYSAAHLSNISKLLMNTIETVIRFAYKSFLTSSMHAQVVEDSYDALKEKNILLKQSENKYKKLAESLDEEVKRKTKEVETVNTQLMQQEKMASIGQLAAGVAHEINNPIGFVNSNLGTLNNYCDDMKKVMKSYRDVLSKYAGHENDTINKSEIVDDFNQISDLENELDLEYLMEDLSAMIDESKEGVNRVKKIVQDLKDFAHPGQETGTFADINKNIDSTLNIVWNELKYKVTVKKDYGDIPPFYCYARQLNQVFMNIFINASHAIPDSGEIEIKTRATEEEVVISIRDTGVGINPENIKRIFDPFFTTKAVGKGTGMGLNLSYNIVKKHKGDIDVESELGKGTTFYIRLPVLKEL